MAVKEEYDVLRLIEHNQACYISSEYVKGSPLFRWIKYHPCVDKEQFFRMVSDIVSQLSQIHRCRGNPCYRYVNPYSIIVSEEGQVSFLDVNAESNSGQLRIMQRRTVREHFLPPEEPYYQTANVEFDIYGLGRTLQYFLSEADTDPLLCRSEEIRFQKVISRCLNRHSKKTFQNVSEIQRMIPKYKKSKKVLATEKKAMTGIFRWMFVIIMIGGAIFIGGAVTISSINSLAESRKIPREALQSETGQTDGMNMRYQKNKAEEAPEHAKEERLSLELGTVYFLELKNYEKSREYFDRVKENVLAEHMTVIVESFSGDIMRAEKLREALINAEKEIEEQDEENIGEKQNYYRCILKGYSILDEDDDFRNILRLGEICLQNSNQEGTAEILGYMAYACEGMGEAKEAVSMYEEQLKHEKDETTREEIFKRAASILIQMGENGQAQEMLRTGIKEIADSAELRTAYIAALLGDSNVERQLCSQTIQEQLMEMPELEKEEEFEKLIKQYGIDLEGDKVWQEK